VFGSSSAAAGGLAPQHGPERIQQLAGAPLALAGVVVAVEVGAPLGQDQPRAGGLGLELDGASETEIRVWSRDIE
jgi:hypothetical protein